MPRAKQRTDELREHVLRIALAILAAEGASGLTTRRVAAEAQTSTPAVYELFGDKAGLVRELFFEGFRELRRRLDRLRATDDPRADVVRVVDAYRVFVRENPGLAEVMFSRPFADFRPGPAELSAGAAVRELVVARVGRCVDGGLITGEPVDIAHALVALAQGLAAQETAGWLGTSRPSRDRRWTLAVDAMLDGLGARVTRPAGSDRLPPQRRRSTRRPT